MGTVSSRSNISSTKCSAIATNLATSLYLYDGIVPIDPKMLEGVHDASAFTAEEQEEGRRALYSCIIHTIGEARVAPLQSISVREVLYGTSYHVRSNCWFICLVRQGCSTGCASKTNGRGENRRGSRLRTAWASCSHPRIHRAHQKYCQGCYIGIRQTTRKRTMHPSVRVCLRFSLAEAI